MAFTCGFFNSVAHDRKYDAVQHGMIFDGIITDGIYATYLKAMVVKASENASEVIVQPGRAWFNHTWSYNDSDYPVAAPEPEVVLDRIDTLVLDVNSEDAVRNNQFLWVQGTPTSQTPEPPELIHTATHNQYPLCDVYRQAGTTMIYAADITNRVGTSDCPFVTGVLESIDIDDLLAQWDDEFHTWENATKASFEGWMVNQQSVYTAWFNALKTQMAGDVADVEAWVQTIKDIIDEETATHLQLEIDEINSMLPSGSHITVTTSDTELYSRTVTITDEDNNTVTSQFDANGVAVFKSVPYVGSLTITSTDGVRTATEVVNTPYFARYEFTLAFWSATVNIIGDSVFGGDTVTITDSTTALVGTVVLNASGAGVFNATYPDTYKFSVTHGGETMEVSLAVTQETTYNVEIHSGINYQAWLNAGGVSESFSSLDEVLEDEKTLRQLFLVHDAVDYVASQRVNDDLEKIFNTDLAAKWINNSDYALEKFYAVADIKTVMDTADKYGYGEWVKIKTNLVPIMTSNTTPSGTVFASSVFENNPTYAAWKAFDKSTSTGWICGTGYYVNSYIGYDFGEATPIKFVSIRNATLARSPVNYKMQGSNDNQTWIDLTSTFNDFTADSQTKEYQLTEGANYRYYRLLIGSIKTTSEQIVQIAELALSNYVWQPKGNIPVMTSNTAPYGEAIKSREYSSSSAYAWKAFDNDPTTSWFPINSTPATTDYVGYKFPNPIMLGKLYIRRADSLTAQSYVAEGSNDNSTWTPVSDTIAFAANEIEKEVKAISNTPYIYLRLRVTAVGTGYTAIRTLQFYGRELKGLVPPMISDTLPYGEAISSGTYSGYSNYKAFNKTNSNGDDCWLSANGQTVDTFLGYKFNKKTIVKAVTIANRNSSTVAAIQGFKLQGRNGNGSWVDIATLANPSSSQSAISVLDVSSNNNAYDDYRIYVTSTYSSTAYVAVGELNFYGLDYSEKEFEEGATKKWLYDHGVELEPMTAKVLGGYGNADKLCSQIRVEAISGKTNSGGIARNTDAIDLTPYNLARIIVGDYLYNGNNASAGNTALGIMDANNIDNPSQTNISVVGLGTYNTGVKEASLNISSITQSLYLEVYASHGSYSPGKIASFNELWLE